jgi:uncharacterized membrane protein YoaK (UPF0700 family)
VEHGMTKHNQMRLAGGKVLGLPNPVPVSERNQKRLGLLLTLTAGYFDGYGLLVLGIYVSFMSGNTTMAGVKAGQENFLAVLAPAVAIVGFVSGSFIGSLITQARIRHTHRILFGVIAAVLVIVLTLDEQLGSHAVLKNFIIGL